MAVANAIVSVIMSAAINNVMRLHQVPLSHPPCVHVYHTSVNLLADSLPAPPSSRSPFPNAKPTTESRRSLVAGCTTGSPCPRCPSIRGRALSLYLAQVFSANLTIKAPEADSSASRHILSADSGSKIVLQTGLSGSRLPPAGRVAERGYTLRRWTSVRA